MMAGVSVLKKVVAKRTAKVKSDLAEKAFKEDPEMPLTAEDLIGSETDVPLEVVAPEPVKTAVTVTASVRPATLAPVTRSAVRIQPQQNGNNHFVRNGVVHSQADSQTEFMEGLLDMMEEGHGFLRTKLMPSPRDVYISSSQIKRFRLRAGDMVGGQARRPKETERYCGMIKVEKVNGMTIEEAAKRPHFSTLVPIYPDEMITLETSQDILTTRLIDLVSPIGKGQRGMLVSPPKAGKTWLLKDIANGVAENYPEIHLMAVLIGERPEEVTDIARSVKGEVIASNFDEPPERQTKIAEIALERARRLVEGGGDVFMLLDSITRLARAYNLSIPTSGRTLTGGFDPTALYPPKKFFGAARNIEGGGSLTIIGTALVETGSKMDDLIYEEFKGTGNMELHLDRRLAERRVYPAIDIQMSGTRQEQLLYDKKLYPQVITMRKMMDMLGREERTGLLIERLKKTNKNEDFLKTLSKGKLE